MYREVVVDGDRVRLRIYSGYMGNISVSIEGSDRLDAMRSKAKELWDRIMYLRNIYSVFYGKLVWENGKCVAYEQDCDIESCATYSRVLNNRVCEDIIPLEQEYYKLMDQIRQYVRHLTENIISMLMNGGLQ